MPIALTCGMANRQGGAGLTQRKQNTQSPWKPLPGFTEYGITWIVFHIIPPPHNPQQKLTGDPWEGPDVPEELFLS